MITITNEEIEYSHNQVIADKIYGMEYKLLQDILKKYSENIDVNIVAMKIALIDVTNSTNLNKYKQKISLSKLANNISKIKNIDERLKNGDLSLIKEIASQQTINLFSFATKYCCYHNTMCYNKDDYSIYDNILKENIGRYIDISPAQIEKFRKNCEYEKYHNLIGNILENNNITIPDKRRKFDHFMWWNAKHIPLSHKQPMDSEIAFS